MPLYICVYQHKTPAKKDRVATEALATSNRVLREYIDAYFGSRSVYDWGDDPAFFSAETLCGDIRSASWGVCRPNVRSNLRENDVVVFFCERHGGQESSLENGYYFIGFGTVREKQSRERIWQEERLTRIMHEK